MKPDIVIFDLDGTLINSIGGIANSANHIIESYGFPSKSVEEYASFIGGGVKGTIVGALPATMTDETMINDIVEKFKKHYSKHPLVDTNLYEGIEQLLDTLEKLNIKIGINTNKHASISYPIIETLFSKWNLSGYLAPDGRIPLKPDPFAANELMINIEANPQNCYYIGDTEVDIQTAVNANMKNILVKWGYRDISKIKAEKVVSTPGELKDYFIEKYQ